MKAHHVAAAFQPTRSIERHNIRIPGPPYTLLMQKILPHMRFEPSCNLLVVIVQ
jgi:hypothetical protein